MTKDRSLTHGIVDGIRSGSLEAFQRLLGLAREIANLESARTYVPSDILDDMVQQTFLDALGSIEKRIGTNDAGIVEIMKGSVVTQIQTLCDRRQLEQSDTDLDFGEVDRDYLLSMSLYGKTSIERILGDLFDQSPLLADFTPVLIYKDHKRPKEQSQARDDVIIVDDHMIKYFTKHPQDLYNLKPRRFEELVAAVLRDLGYFVELTAQSADGGVDIFATQKSGVGEVLIVEDCKRYASDNHVGVGIVRALFGIGEQMRATMAMVATTSFFTKAAKEFQGQVRHRLSLRDYNDVLSWLRNYGFGKNHPGGLSGDLINEPSNANRNRQ